MRLWRVLLLLLAVGFVQCLALHELLHVLAARLGVVSSLLAPSSQSRAMALSLGVAFIITRLALLVVWPPVLMASAGFLGACAAERAFWRRRGSP